MKKAPQIRSALLVVAMWLARLLRADAADEINVGPAFSKYRLTLESGFREDFFGPLYYRQTTGAQVQWGLPPFFDRTVTAGADWSEWDLFYPMVNYRRFGTEYRWQIGQVFNIAGGESSSGNPIHHTTVFPFYFHEASTATNNGYTAVFPFYGHLQNRMFRDDIKFVMFPAYSVTQKKGVVTTNYFYPFYDVRGGNGVEGWQIWPFYGVERKKPTTVTNSMGDVEPVAAYDHTFKMWPFYFRNFDGIGTTNAGDSVTFIPFYSRMTSAGRDETSYGFPIGYNVVHDREKGYDERDIFWPLWVKADGSKTVRRYFPFYSHAEHNGLESDFILFFFYKYNRLQAAPLDRHRSRILYFLYSDTVERNTESHDFKRIVDFWPFYSYHRDLDGNRRLQVMAILDPILPNNRVIAREFSPFYTFWQNEKNSRTRATSQSLFWNFYRRETTVKSKKISLCFGLFQYESSSDGHQWRFFRFGRSGAKS